MSRRIIALEGGRFIVCGYDKPYGTWYAQLYEPGDTSNDCPRAAIGYAPEEQEVARGDRPDVRLGPYPVGSREDLVRLIREEWRVQLSLSDVPGVPA